MEADSSSDESSSSSSSGSGGGGGGGGTVATDEQTADGTAVTTEQTADGTTATIERVGADDPTVSIAVEGAAAGSFAVTESSTAFEEGTDAEGTVSVSASAARPANAPSPPGDDRVLGYVSVDIEGALADDVAEGSFTIDLSGGDIHPADVTARRYNGDQWQRVETRSVGDTSVEVVSPDGYSTFTVGTGETDEPASTDTPATTATPTGANPEESTETATSTPAAVEVEASTRTATATSTPTPGASGPGFGILIVLLALVVTIARLRRA